MLRDVFYYGNKPNVHPREKFATSIEDARQQCTTEHFWIINEYCDYQNFDWDFDFEFLPNEDVWAEEHNNVWPSQHQKDSGTWLCSSQPSQVIIYRNDVNPVIRKNIKNDNWVLVYPVDETKFDFSWHPDPTDPPYIHSWGCKFFPVELQACVEYHAPGASTIKYMRGVVELLPQPDKFDHFENSYDIDYSWVPDPTSPPYIYVWGNQWNKPEDKISIQYVVEGATEYKFMKERATRKPCLENWAIPENIDYKNFDYSWEPSPAEPPFIYQFGTQWQKTGGPRYEVEGATEIKYIDIFKAKRLVNMTNWTLPKNIDIKDFDFSWHPDDTSPPYIYRFPTQWAMSGGPVYVVPEATEIKYIDTLVAKATASMDNWEIPDYIDVDNFDYSWHPYIEDEPYIYQFGTQWQKTGGPKYITPGTNKNSPVKYIDTRIIKAKRLPNKKAFTTLDNIVIKDFDYSWHPDTTEESFIYVFGNTQYPAEIMPTIEYVMPGATQIKYINDIVVKLGENRNNWIITQPIAEDNFDFSWVPNPKDPPYIYTWGNKYISNLYKPTIQYKVEGAIEIKYMDDLVKVLPELDKWVIPANIDDSFFDYTWRPDPLEPDLIWQFGTQWQKTGGPRYIVPGATEIKYVDTQKVKVLPNNVYWKIIDNLKIKEFDYSWHPDETEESFIYVFGNTQYPAEIMPTIEYVMPGATQIKYIGEVIALLDVDMNGWIVPDNIDIGEFDFSWKPNPKDPAYIYEFGTQWQKTGGPRYIIPGATEIKYVDTQKVKILTNKLNWIIPKKIDITDFDFSWHPDDSSPPYIYRFPTQWATSGGPEYIVSGATEIKYIDILMAKAVPDKTNWEFDPTTIDVNNFDFSWHPYIEDEPYIYQFGTQWQKTGGPRYVTPGAHKNSPVKYIDTRIIKSKRLSNKKYWRTVNNYVIADFDYSWHPDETEESFIYVFGNTQYPAEIMPTIEYYIPGADQYKYINDIVVKLGENKLNWIIPNNVDTTDFDFSWVPNPKDPAYIYEFGTQWQKTGGPRYIVPGATEIKYVDTQKVLALPNKNNWVMPIGLKIASFDYSWHPDATEEDYIYQFGTQWVMTGGPKYVMPGATQVKYIDNNNAIIGPNKANWVIPKNIAVDQFDFSWHPHPDDPMFIYHFGTQWQKTGGPKYLTPGVNKDSPVKYIDTRIIKAKRLPEKDNFIILDNIVIKDFDYSWHPDETDTPFIYVFGNTQYPAEIMPTIQYIPKEIAKLSSDNPIGQIKYVTDIVAKLGPNKTNWVIPDNVIAFDYSWVPNPKDPDYIYEFGTQWHDRGGPRYVPNSIPRLASGEPIGQIKYVTDIVAKLGENKSCWNIPDDIDLNNFDFSWVPHPNEPAYIYIFGTQWQKTGGPTYVPEAIPILASGKPIGQLKYVDSIHATKLPSKKYWFNPNQSDISTFDYSWHPDETAPPYIYQFGTLLDKEDGPRYMSPNTNGEIIYLERVERTEIEIEIPIEKIEGFPKYIITTTLEDLIEQHPNKLFWALNPDLDYSEFDFDWRPDIEQSQYLHAFGSQDNINTQTYFVNAASWLKGFKDINYVEDKTINVKINIDMFFVDRSNNESQVRFEGLKQQFPNIQKTRYLNSWVDTINRCINRASSNLCWILNSELDYSDFDFNYYPNPWQMKMVHVFGTQWSHWGTTFMVNRETFAQDTKFIKIIEHLSNLNFVKDRKAKATNILYDIVYIDHGNTDMTQLKKEGKLIVNYQDSYIATLQKMLSMLTVKKEHYVWVASTVCDYKDFDFTYICDPFAKDQLHVFPSDRQKFGDTFLIDVNKLRTLIEDMNTLEDYEKINYNQSQRVKRLSAPVIVTKEDTHVNNINSIFNFPYAVFITEDNKDINIIDTEPMSLWTPESKNIQITSVGGTRIVVPKEAKDYIKHELYDYPYIITNSRLAKSNPLDIVFFSNGETSADTNYEHLLKITQGLPNKVVRIDGVSGRVNSQHVAANSSDTQWYFLVNAKLKVNSKFDFNWQPDRLQIPKHYIFHATNPVNGLKYGHQAIVANNKKLTLENFGTGLDFTMDSEHEIIKINSGVAIFNTSAWDTWRTAFRECIKLKASSTDESKERLEMWLTVGMGEFNEYSMEGAQHAVEYYNEVNGDFDKLRLSYDWPWLKEKFNFYYNI